MRLNNYIQGNRRGKEANQLERKALNDSFMQDALDGFDTVAGNHVKIIEELEKKYTGVAIVRQTRIFYWSVAASILLLIGFGAYFFWERNENDIPVIAMNQLSENESAIPVDSPALPPVQIEESRQKSEESQQKVLVAAKATGKTTPTPSSTMTFMDESDSSYLSEDNRVNAEQDLPEQSEALMADENSAKLIITEPEEKIIHGKVIDETGNPLIGVSIAEKGTQNGTFTNSDGNFTLQLSKDDSSKLIANYIGYNSKEINPSGEFQTVTLEPNTLALSEVVVVGYGTQKKVSVMGAIASISKSESIQQPFGEKEFQFYCQQKADKNKCDGQGATVKVSFFIDEAGKPSKIEYKQFSCEEAREEIENLLSSSPAWTKTNRKVTMTVKW